MHVKENPKIHMRITTIHRLYVVFRNLIFQATSRIQAASFFCPASWGVGTPGRSPGKLGTKIPTRRWLKMREYPKEAHQKYEQDMAK